jgi:hypothetical protein
LIRLGRPIALVTLAVAPAAVAAASSTQLSGSWRRLPAAPIAPNSGLTSVWTGKQLLLFGRDERHDKTGAVTSRVAVGAAFDARTRTWRRLPSPGATQGFTNLGSAWTGNEVLVWGQGTRLAYNPATGAWRRLPASRLLSVHDGFAGVVWTGRELLGWGGGCCGDAFDDGVAYNPATNRWRALPHAPLTPGGGTAAWTGHDYVVVSRDVDPDGKRYPARLARAAAYHPATNKWRRIATPPALGGTAIWDGRELLLVGAGRDGRSTLAYAPATNRWRRLASPPSGRFGAAVALAGSRVLLWGGYRYANGTRNGRRYPAIPARGLAFDPVRNAWSTLPQAPIAARSGATGAWTGTSFVVWGGTNPKRPVGTGTVYYADGASFTPAK